MTIDPLAIALIGNYPVRRFIAQGGMAWVYEVLDPRFEGQEVVRALKMLKPEAAAGEEFLRFRQEAGLLAGIDHPNLVTIFDFGRDEETGCFYYVMTYVDGPTMADYIREYGRLEVGAVGPIFLDILSALGELHDRGIVHRDIKPANVLIGSDNRARLSDLGIARVESGDLATRTNIALGTVKFMAPEQARGRSVGPASDVFAVGLTLFHALTGKYIYDQIEGIDSTSQLDILGYLNSLERTGESIEFEFDRELGIPAAIQNVVRGAVRYKPEDRYPDARTMHDALREALYGDETQPHPIRGGTGRGFRWPAMVAAGAVAAAAVGFGVYNFLIVPRTIQADVTALENSIRALRLDVPATLQRVRDIDGAVSLELVNEVETAIGSAQTAWQYAQEGIDNDAWSSAATDLQRARSSYATACEVLGRTEIAARASTAVASLQRQRNELGVVFAELEAIAKPGEAIQQSWDEFQATVAGLSTPAKIGPCGAVVLSLDQIDAVSGSQELIRSLEKGLSLVAPLIAQKAREAATEARNRAEASSVNHRAYRNEIAKGNKLLADGDRLVSSEPLRARDVFGEATKAFESASDIVPAIQARTDLRKLEQELPPGGIDLGRAPLIISEAANHFANGQWSDAETAYREAANLIASRLGSERIEKEAANRRSDAREYRSLALKDGAEEISPAPFGRAEQAFAEAERAMGAEDFATAAKSFEKASQIYREARTGATTALQTARDAKADLSARFSANLDGRSCSEFESGTAAGDCNVAVSATDQGDRALEEGRIEEANRLYAKATRALMRSAAEEARFLSTKPQPPVMTGRFPRSQTVEVLRGTPQRLEVIANDPNEDDRLSYAWRFDGELVGEVTEQTFEFTPKRAGRVSVTVADTTGHTFETSWQISIKNLPPELTVVPKGTITLSRGQSQRFTATARDPDGTPVSTEFFLNGSRVGQGSEYTFNKTAPGRYSLEVVTRDVDGGTARATRKIRITNLAPELTVTPSHDVEIDAGQQQRFESRTRDPEGTAVSVSYKIDTETVGRGDLYTFGRTEPGTYLLEIFARDVDGAVTSRKRNIVVRAGDIFPPISWDGEEGVFEALRKYKAALESRDIRKLERVWLLPSASPHRDIWVSRFKRYTDVSIRLEIVSTRRLSNDKATISLVQVESMDGGRERSWTVNATMLNRVAGWQIISYDRKRKR